ncbi:secondary thiamine-phosphate synthase enzyme YjbQ [uncultured Umboniibacter sp.]|uniref:secondary thiamine-phosphate synthase enzyme YjbQ n=1 Tax=uncultured Umboniibacter sp. TaxID=1798917 RepID=UPI002622074A|nr:secondary thiamine-phosphate synthase enzyme YjbQ [uncultured Umboniibacter sp.]
MNTFHRALQLKPLPRGFHLITPQVIEALPEIAQMKAGIVQIFVQHTSASLTINENADSSVRRDFERFFNRLIPDGCSYFEHQDEGPDDMPAHIKASLLGHALSIPVSNGELALGIWQGIYLGEHRDHGGSRNLQLTVIGSY